ncbi:WD repeat and coiled-coil-containing protein [Anguilla rostrata]|uniref:WD repeat and coiled-coil-containing protein n=1 Tax=Anguilla rostrata TaxID=7938 RepID=UPI0030D451E9
MDLGKVKLPRTGLNTLQQAIHPVHGIAWTDGKQVCLTSFQCADGAEPQFGDTNVIGQFEHVLGLRWGPLCCADSPALLALQHKKHVTVWQLQLSTAEQSKLLCTQTCELGEPFPLLAQGCVWHPRADALALLTRRDASVLWSVRGDAQRVRAEIRGGGLVHCACWTGDGARLVVAVGTALHCYAWNDAERTLAPCGLCPVFDVGGYVCALESVGEAQVAAATELPLDRICGLNAGMTFDVPSRRPVALTVEEDPASDSRRRSADSDRSLLSSLRASSPSGLVDLTHVLGRHRRSDPSPLLYLRPRDTLTGSGQDSSHLIVVTFDRKATTSRRLAVPGILVPDIIALDPSGRAVAVASNTCSVVLVYAVSAATMPKLQQIQLQKNERPKGMRFLGDRRLLLMVGQQKASDSAFLPSSSTDKYVVRLLTRDLEYDDEASGQLPAQNPHYPSFSFPGARRGSENVSRGERFGGITELVLPSGALAPPLVGRRRLIEEVQSEEEPSPTVSLTDFSDRVSSSTSSIAVETLSAEPGGGVAGLLVGGRGPGSRESSRCGSPRFAPADRPAEQHTQDTERIFARFAEMQQRVSKIQDYVLNGRRASSCYPSRAEAPYVIVSCQKQVSETVFIEDRRPVLLCEGKLCLRVLQDLFNMQVLEMLHGSLWVVLVPDADGFVPLTFEPKEELTVRNGKRKLPRSPGDGDTPS